VNRKLVDLLASSLGVVMVGVLVIAGILALWGFRTANSNVHNQLAQQQIFFPPKGSPALTDAKIGPFVDKYAGQQVLDGPQARAYSEHFIAVHLSEMPFAGVYSKVSDASRANPNDAALAAEVQTVFRGTTLRGLLLEAYGFWTVGQIALWGAIAAFILAGVMAVLSLFGFMHARRVTQA
jgi:hypothetical protein